MTFLPIVVRELRVAARKRRTFWLRIVAALVALVIGAGIMVLSRLGAFSSVTLGSVLFGVLTWLALMTVLAAGLFFTSDCLSEEKREGTLGFLFLTDLRGYDVAGGKLLATSLRSVYALLAVFPILALTLIMGGVTGAGFWKTTLALLNALVCSLTAGMFVSAISRDSQKALGGTLFVLFLWLAGGPIADIILAAAKIRIPALLSLSSPYYAFRLAGAWDRTLYWTSLLITQAIAWLLFATACLLVPRTWQERPAKTASVTATWSYAWRYGGQRRRAALRLKLISRNPVLWLACRERWQSIGVWVFAFIIVGLFIAVFAFDVDSVGSMLWTWVRLMGVWVLYLWAASQSNRFFIDARRSGMIELLLATPLTVNDIIRGQWRALARMFGAPVILILLMNLLGIFLAQHTSWRAMMGAGLLGLGGYRAITFASALVGTGNAIANLIALVWFGMWMGLTSKNYSLATLKALAFVQIIPAFAITFVMGIAASAMFMPAVVRGGLASGKAGAFSASLMAWSPLITVALQGLLTLAKDAGLVVLARNRLYASFRTQASRSLSASPFAPPPVDFAPPMPVPPEIVPRH